LVGENRGRVDPAQSGSGSQFNPNRNEQEGTSSQQGKVELKYEKIHNCELNENPVSKFYQHLR